ncbi:MAG TPA: gamma-glutamyltransferase [Steroidobacteraceae bacterium]|nr:gamma-glutamyltransferase [Steroidobacteraceae bacterium]
MRAGQPVRLAWPRALLLAALVWLACAPALSAAPLPPKAAIASSHPLASQAGLDMLARGGNAFDAAIAVSAVLAVVEPASSGVGGGGFYLLHVAADGHDVMVDARETAPAAARRDMYIGPNGKPRPGASTEGPLAAGIPGEPAAWAWLARRYGRLPLAVSLAPAIRVAREGFPLYARLANAIHVKQAQLARSRDTAGVFLIKDQPPPVGALIRQQELARTLALIAGSGSEAFYKGPFAAQLVAHVRHEGGIWSEADLAGYRIVERAPIKLHYRNATLVMAAPPASGGIVIGEALNILAGYDLAGLDATTRRHLIIEALRHAYRDRAEYLGDPDFVSIPVEQLLSPYYAAGQRTSIRLDRATPSETLRPAFTGEESQSTTHFSVLDREGNRVAATLSINLFFGATYMAPGTGVILNNTMDDFAVAAGVPNAFELVGADANAIAPGKRPLSSMTPTFVDTDHGMLIIGTPGGATIISNLLFSVLNWLDGKSAAEIVSMPRIHHQYVPDIIVLEPGALTPEERAQLEKLGHHLREARNQWGNTEAVTWDFGSGKVEAASDPRGYGAGLVY